MAKRRSGLTKAINRLSKEEVEQLDELSPKTLALTQRRHKDKP